MESVNATPNFPMIPSALIVSPVWDAESAPKRAKLHRCRKKAVCPSLARNDITVKPVGTGRGNVDVMPAIRSHVGVCVVLERSSIGSAINSRVGRRRLLEIHGWEQWPAYLRASTAHVSTVRTRRFHGPSVAAAAMQLIATKRRAASNPAVARKALPKGVWVGVSSVQCLVLSSGSFLYAQKNALDLQTRCTCDAAPYHTRIARALTSPISSHLGNERLGWRLGLTLAVPIAIAVAFCVSESCVWVASGRHSP